MRWSVLSCLWVATVLTVISGAAFFWRYRMAVKAVMGR